MREKLIELLDEATDKLKGLCGGYNDGTGNTVRADHLIANGVTFATDNNVGDKMTPTDKDINVPSKWISVKDRLPEEFTSCIVYRIGSFGGHYSMLWYSPELGWHFYDSERGDVTVNDVIRWMQLPEPPKGE